MNETKLKGMMGLALRARHAAAGTDTCERLIHSGRCGVLLLDDAVSENTRKKAETWCRHAGTRMILMPAGMIAEATGRDTMMLAVEQDFSKGFLDDVRDTDR